MAAATKPQSALADRIRQARADADAFIDATAAEMKKEFPTLPVQTLRMEIARGCPCTAALRILEKAGA
jgi:hypothetical protein